MVGRSSTNTTITITTDSSAVFKHLCKSFLSSSFSPRSSAIAGLLGDVEDDRGALDALPASPSIVTNAGSFSSQSSSSLKESGPAFYFGNLFVQLIMLRAHKQEVDTSRLLISYI